MQKYVEAGKPIVAVRTASHAFQNWLALDKEVHWVKESPDANRHVVIQEVRGLRYLQVDRRIIVLKLEFHLALEEKPFG